MEIVKDFPPNFEEICQVFPSVKKTPGVVFCWGSRIYSPLTENLPEAILMHEKVHSLRQGDNPEKWWKEYIINREFRFYEELLAHVAEYEFLAKNTKSRNQRRLYLSHIADKLSSPIYGSMIQRDRAKLYIKGKIPLEEKQIILDKLGGVKI